jgi:hypothetical protein
VYIRTYALRVVAAALSLASAFGQQAQESSRDWPPTPPQIEVRRLPNGVRVIHLPQTGPGGGDTVEISFGYVFAPGGGAGGEVTRAWLRSSVPARTAELIAHLGGGEFRFVDDPELAGLRVRVPAAFADAVVAEARAFIDQRLEAGELVDYVLDPEVLAGRPEPATVMDRAADAVATGLLGRLPRSDSFPTAMAPVPDAATIEAHFRGSLGTDRAWIVFPRPPREGDLDVLGEIRERPSVPVLAPEAEHDGSLAGDLTLPSEEVGGVVVGARIAGVHYEAWFNALIVDRALRRILDPSVRFEFAPSRVDNVHLLKLPVRLPDYAQDARDSTLRAIEALRFGLPPGVSLPEVKRDALDYLGSREILEWFAVHELWGPLGDGWSRTWNLTEEDFRSAAAAFWQESRLTAVWAPAFASPAVSVGGLGIDISETGEALAPVPTAPGEIEVPRLAILPASGRRPITVERLPSGLSVAQGSPAVFVSGPFAGDLPGGWRESGPNGTLWSFDDLDPQSVLPLLADVRADRVLVFLPPGELERRWGFLEAWNGGEMDATDSTGVGTVATADLPALIILKTWLEGRIIEAGWSDRVEIRIAGTEGSDLSIRTDPGREIEIRAWLRGTAGRVDSDRAREEFLQFRAAAGPAFDLLRRDLQILLWQRAPEGRILPPDTVSYESFRSVLDIYF